jgi:iron complex outermembrane receptor protein
VTQDRDVDGYERYGARAMLDFKVTDRLFTRLTADYSETNDNCCAEFVRRDDGSIRAQAVLMGGATLPTGEEAIKFAAINALQRSDNENIGFALDSTYDFDGFSLTSISSYREWDNTERQDIDDGPFGATERDGDDPANITLDSVDGVLVGQPTARDFGPQTWEQWTQEFRISSDDDARFTWQAGAYLGFSNVDRQFSRFDALCVNDPGGLIGGVDIGGLGATDFCPTSNIVLPSATADMTIDNDSYALFGHGNYNIDEKWSVTGGIRFTYDEISFTHQRERVGDEFIDILGNQDGNPNNDGGVFALQTDQSLQSGSTDNANLSGTFSVNYQASENLFVYAKYARGYKGPAFNNFFNALSAESLGLEQTADFNGSFTPIEGETSNAYELGFKWQLDRAVFSVVGFRQDYSNFQANNFVITAGAVTTNLTNAGDVRTQGIEFEGSADLSEHFSIYGGITFADAEINDFCAGLDLTRLGGNCDPRKGEDLPFAPKIKGSVTLDYDRPVGNGMALLVSNNLVFQSESFGALNENPNERIDGYYLYNASIGVSFDEGRYEVRVFGKNLFDQSFIVATNEGGAVARLPRDQSRYFGVQLKAGF